MPLGDLDLVWNPIISFGRPRLFLIAHEHLVSVAFLLLLITIQIQDNILVPLYIDQFERSFGDEVRVLRHVLTLVLLQLVPGELSICLGHDGLDGGLDHEEAITLLGELV